MHTYRKVFKYVGSAMKKDYSYQVGLWYNNGEFEQTKVFKKELHAIAFVNFLNGGPQSLEIISELLKEGGETL